MMAYERPEAGSILPVRNDMDFMSVTCVTEYVPTSQEHNRKAAELSYLIMEERL